MRLKSWTIWIECGDNNTKLFQSFPKGRKQQNTIWELKKANNETTTSFEDLARTGKEFFENLFKANQQATIAELIQISQLFPKSITEEENLELMEEISEEELKETLNSFQKHKSPGPYEWTMEFFPEACDTIGHDLLQLVEETRVNGVLHPPLNSTFLALIPKKDNLESLEDFSPISLCNITYKVVAKIIAQIFKKVLSKIISLEQFGFLKNI